MAKIINLDAIMLSPAAVAAWQKVAQRLAPALREISEKRGDALDIPDEQGRVNDDGSLTIFVEIPGVDMNISLEVPASQWAYIQ